MQRRRTRAGSKGSGEERGRRGRHGRGPVLHVVGCHSQQGGQAIVHSGVEVVRLHIGQHDRLEILHIDHVGEEGDSNLNSLELAGGAVNELLDVRAVVEVCPRQDVEEEEPLGLCWQGGGEILEEELEVLVRNWLACLRVRWVIVHRRSRAFNKGSSSLRFGSGSSNRLQPGLLSPRSLDRVGPRLAFNRCRSSASRSFCCRCGRLFGRRRRRRSKGCCSRLILVRNNS
mmetsp:Transcript_32962/g.75401  ORF Transcript_32962/g.75401 Transcript_32962/m.75401 type:complete len:229 (-) Transcript_32962:1821-2507(-)